MAKVSTIKKEWYQQVEDLEKWMFDKTVAEIKALKVKTRDASHTAVPDVPELTSYVTITVQDYIDVVEESLTNSK
jgi:tetrahydromethanopterin S-methyltransferase subunit H